MLWLVLYPDGATNLVYNTSTQEWEPQNGTAAQTLFGR